MLIQEYREEWSEYFQCLASEIKNRLKLPALRIEHVGSTAIHGMPAKPIIDIDIVFDSVEQFNCIKSGLESMGYYHNGDQGIKDREVFKRKLFSVADNILDTIPHHLYVCHVESRELERHLLFRDYLRSHESVKVSYSKLKTELAQEAGQDKKKYAILKEEKATVFIESIIQKAKSKIKEVIMIREATTDDIQQIQIVRNAVKENTLSDPALVTDTDCETYLMHRGKGWVSEQEGKVIGFSIVDLEEHNVWALFLMPDYEGRGIGTQLQKIMLDWYFSKTDTTIWLGTEPGTRAEQFYRRSGWQETGKHGKNEIKFEMTKAQWLRLQSA